jgi:hypothetical protein
MKDLEWFPPIPEPRRPAVPPIMGSIAVTAGVGWWVYAHGHGAAAFAVWIAAAVLACSLLFPTLRKQVVRAGGWLAQGAGRITAFLLLWPFYVLVFGGVRLALAVARIDLLGLQRRPDWPSYWEPATPEAKRARYYHRLFTVEPRRQESAWLARAMGAVVLVLVLAGGGEAILRTMGFGHPVLYRADPQVGYYPAPHQDVHRYGGEIHINAFGMRSREVAARKPADAFRILMLGDSTLYGGSYIDQSEMYATRLETLLNRQASGLPGAPQRVEVLCMGVNAWGPQHELAYVKKFGLFQADLVMVMGPAADAYRPRYGVEDLPFFTEKQRPQFAWQEFWLHVRWEFKERSEGTEERAAGAPSEADVMSAGVAAWLEIAALGQAQGARVDFELLPNEGELRAGRADESTQRVLDALLPALAAHGIPSAYPLQALRAGLVVERFYHDGVHLDIGGHKVYASYLRGRVSRVMSTE